MIVYPPILLDLLDHHRSNHPDGWIAWGASSGHTFQEGYVTMLPELSMTLYPGWADHQSSHLQDTGYYPVEEETE